MEKIHVTWEEAEKFVMCVRNKYLLEKPFTGVYGLPRGGLVLAVMLSHKLNIPLLASPAPGCLIVDDICDSGESLVHYVKNTSGGHAVPYAIVTLFYRPNELGIVPDYYYDVKKDDVWVVFPWEVE